MVICRSFKRGFSKLSLAYLCLRSRARRTLALSSIRIWSVLISISTTTLTIPGMVFCSRSRMTAPWEQDEWENFFSLWKKKCRCLYYICVSHFYLAWLCGAAPTSYERRVKLCEVCPSGPSPLLHPLQTWSSEQPPSIAFLHSCLLWAHSAQQTTANEIDSNLLNIDCRHFWGWLCLRMWGGWC